MKKYLVKHSREFDFDLYKFTGYGGIFLFEYDCSGENLFDFVQDLSRLFHNTIKKLAEFLLETYPDILGLTFGIDIGH